MNLPKPALAAAIPLRHLTVSVSYWDEPMLAIQSFDSPKSTFALQYMLFPFPPREKSDGVDNCFESREMALIGGPWFVVEVSREAVQPLHILTGSSAGRAVKGTISSCAIQLARGGTEGTIQRTFSIAFSLARD